ncbi:MAG: aspartate--tRNA ligase [Deltaproteobacteria bacterium]|nr:aspartate--tRNA ligase [Deltaproteobacteria bacterium]
MNNEQNLTNIDPLGDWKRSHDCGSLRQQDIDRKIILMGWVNRRRDLGNLIFIDLRDREGITQVVFDPQVNAAAHEKAHVLRNEWVLAVKGTVVARLEGQENHDLATGQIEVRTDEVKILNVTETPPFQVDGAVDASENLRLKYRYLELRRPQILKNFKKRHAIASCIRAYLDERGFIEVETPFLTKSTPEGARDYLVPSRVNTGMFYALPQSPQLFKQLLMMSGFDRYYQVVRCFRDEDLRADRQPEFTQVDLEMAFVDEKAVMDIFEGMMDALFTTIMDMKISSPIPHLTYQEAMDRFGTDRPDLRFDMELENISDIAEISDFKVFKGVVAAGGMVKAICVKQAASTYSRKALDDISLLATANGAKGLAWIKVAEDTWQSPIGKFFDDEAKSALNTRLDAAPGDLILMVADQPRIVNAAMGALRLEMAHREELIKKGRFSFVWITDFPLLEYDDEIDRFVAVHHPFTAPVAQDLGFLRENPGKVRARAYDLVLNGSEIGGGSIRIHDAKTQEMVFDALGIPSQEARSKFGFLIDALKHGAPPHGGMALGFDRLVAIMTGVRSIREIIAFPKTTSGTCPLTDAPSPVDPDQLKELGLRISPAKQSA